jgi:hypothetical protein
MTSIWWAHCCTYGLALLNGAAFFYYSHCFPNQLSKAGNFYSKERERKRWQSTQALEIYT